MAKNSVFLKALLGVLLFCGSDQLLNAQSAKKYWVRFNTKNGTPYSINNPSAFLTQKSIDRRQAFNIPVVESDLPVNPSFVAQVDNISDIQVLYASKWMNGVVISTSNMNSLASVKALPFVSDTFKVNKYRVNFGQVPAMAAAQTQEPLLQKNQALAFNYGASYWQNKMLNVDCLHNQGFTGLGIIIAVMDAGFFGVDSYAFFDSIRAYGRILGTRNFVNGGTNVFANSTHGTMVLSCMGANLPGKLVGSAPHAEYWLFTTEETGNETISEEYNWIRAAEFADSVGAHILTTSLGYTTFQESSQNHNYSDLNGRTAPMSIAANLAARKGMFVVNSAGNEGASLWQYISVAADADSVCAVGAVDSLGVYSAYSGKGPTFDGRTKPDLVARGTGAWVCFDGTTAFPANGTSFSAPILAGAVACYWQAHKSFSNIKILDTLRHTASNANNPDNFIGWGIPNMCAIPVGLNELNKQAGYGLKAFPNPFSSQIELSWEQGFSGPVELILYNGTGTCVYRAEIPARQNNASIFTGTYAEGIYMLELRTSTGSTYQKLICRQ